MEIAVGKLRIVLKQRMLPRRSPTAAVLAIGQDRRAAADSGRAARRVSGVQPVADHLAKQLDIGCLSTTRARRRELEIRLCELDVFDRLVVDNVLFQVFVVHCNNIEVVLFRLHLLKRRHGKCIRQLFVLVRRAGRQAHAAAQAVVRRNLHTVRVIRRVLAQAFGGHGDEGGRNPGLFRLAEEHRTDGRVWAAHRAAVALEAGFRIPLGNLGRYAALGIGRRAVFPCAVQHAVLLEDGNRQLIPLLAVHRQHDFPDKRRGVFGLDRRGVGGVRPCSRDIHLNRGGDANIDRLIVQIDDFLSRFFEVRIVVVFLHIRNRHIQRDDLGQREESALQNAVRALAETDLRGQFGCVNDVKICVFVRQIALHLAGQPPVQFFGRPWAVQQIRAAILKILRCIIFIDKGRRMHRNKIRGRYRVGGTNRRVSEAQMRLGQTAGFHRVISEICLRIFIGDQTNGRNGVFVGADCPVASKTPQFARYLTRMRQLDIGIAERRICHVVVDADGKVVLRLVF